MLRPQFTQAPKRRAEGSALYCTNASRSMVARGFTLVEILVATVLTLILMGMVVTVFGTVTEEISNSRASIETADRLRSTQLLLQRDLAGATARMVPPLSPGENLGYFEYIEGPIGPVLPLRPIDVSSPLDNVPDGYDLDGDGSIDIEGTTLGDFDDVLMFTSRNLETPFRGIANGQSISSPVAEVIWFLRGTTLYRRVLLVAPGMESRITNSADSYYDINAFTEPGFYGKYDLSARQVGGPNDINAGAGVSGSLRLNTLGDLTKRENRYGHQPWAFPHDARFWGLLGMPTLQECSFYSNTNDLTTGLWPFPLQGGTVAPPYNSGTSITLGALTFPLIIPVQAGVAGSPEYMTALTKGTGKGGVLVPAYANDYLAKEFHHEETLADGLDPWFNSIPWHDVDSQNGTLKGYDIGTGADYYAALGGTAGSTRIAEDVVLTNVLSFDVKVWDPGAPVLLHQTNAGQVVSVLPHDPGYVNLLGFAMSNSPTYPTPPAVGEAFIASYGAYVDLNYMCRTLPGSSGVSPLYDQVFSTPAFAGLYNTGAIKPWFNGPGEPRSHLMGTLPVASPTITAARAAVYDTWSTHYEYDGINQDGDGVTATLPNGIVDEGSDGFDNLVTNSANSVYIHNDSTGARAYGVDDYNEQEAVPPYPSPLKGVQITIRVFEPDSRSIREVTIVQDFQAAASGTNYE